MHGMLTWAKPVCGKVKGTDGWGMPTMHLQFKGRPVDDNPLPFSKDRNDFYAAANICGACCEALAKLEVSA
jgi:hypothetical protein